jgi:hypothetical protein
VSKCQAADGRNQPLGYVGGYAGLAKLVARWRYDAPTRARGRRVVDVPPITIVTRHVSPPVAAALLGRPRALLSERQAETVDALKDHCPGFTTMRRLVLSFGTPCNALSGNCATTLAPSKAPSPNGGAMGRSKGTLIG